MENSSAVVIGFLCFMLVVQSGDRGSMGANGDYYDYGSCNAMKDNVPMSSCDQCEVACARIFTKPLCAYDSVNNGAYVCMCCI
ncbi:hypothetical protein MKW94_029241 [Papaver nudicaule]|uniref:Uncharacterized protein n=1 Tax=Papaver nudicaule TaxID=74823 RepID=A0AA42B1T1_PAPNU|nr:hypothetical protein [Papaver nudicaule]